MASNPVRSYCFTDWQCNTSPVWSRVGHKHRKAYEEAYGWPADPDRVWLAREALRMAKEVGISETDARHRLRSKAVALEPLCVHGFEDWDRCPVCCH